MSCSIAIVGATGLVGTTLLQLLEERSFPIKKIYLLASEKSSGKYLSFRNESILLQDLDTFDFTQTQLAFFCVSNALAEKYAPIAGAAGSVVIDKSYFYRNDPEVPLIIPEVNLQDLPPFRKKNIIASPNCNTIPVAVGLKPIYDAVGISRINISTYQSVSGTGKDAINELMAQTQQILNHQPIYPKVYAQQIAFNVLPHIDDFLENGYTREEMKIVWEMQKIFNDNNLAINPTAVRVPVVCGHAASVHIETKDKMTATQAKRLLSQSPGIKMMPETHDYPTPAVDAAGKDSVYIGRIREDISHEKGLNLWIVADNLRKGAALNALQIAEYLLQEKLVTA
ncbi:MAG: aspartate-semialdehyde dehydrogenase [Gammaproteobacteria bacterium]|nr:aspartate-semialdehyde dehydrogenase [Gammaproteobacteria bacterium]